MGNMLITSTVPDECDNSSMFDVFTSTLRAPSGGEEGHSSAKKRPSQTITQAEKRKKEAAERVKNATKTPRKTSGWNSAGVI